MHRIRHIAITAEDPFVTAELFKRAFGLAELSRGDGDLARECTSPTGTSTWPSSVGSARRRTRTRIRRGMGSTTSAFRWTASRRPKPGPGRRAPRTSHRPTWTSRRWADGSSREEATLAGVKFDLSSEGWATTAAEARGYRERQA